jgi:hypothetical protein
MITGEALMAFKEKMGGGTVPKEEVKKAAAKSESEDEIGSEALNRQAMNTYFRKKMAGIMAKKNPQAWEQISKKWSELSKDPVQNNAQARQRVSWEYDQGRTRLSEEELRQELGDEYDLFMELRRENSSYNTGITKNSEETMRGFGFDDLAPTIYSGTYEDRSRGAFYKPSYDGKKLVVETNIPKLSKLAGKTK